MRRTAFPMLLLLAAAMLACAGPAATPVKPMWRVEPDSALAKSMLDAGAGEELVTPHIIGGQFSGPGQFPYMAFTLTRGFGVCSGSILAPGWVLSVRGEGGDRCEREGTPHGLIEVFIHPIRLNHPQAAHCFDEPLLGDSGSATLGTNQL